MDTNTAPTGFGQIMLCVYCVLNTNYAHKIPHYEYNYTKTTEIVSCTTPSVPLINNTPLTNIAWHAI